MVQFIWGFLERAGASRKAKEIYKVEKEREREREKENMLDDLFFFFVGLQLLLLLLFSLSVCIAAGSLSLCTRTLENTHTRVDRQTLFSMGAQAIGLTSWLLRPIEFLLASMLAREKRDG